MSAAQTCIRGCTVRGQHIASAHEPSDEFHVIPLEECGGCMPRLAEEEATLCRGCIARAARALVAISDIGGWVRENVERGTRRDATDINYDPVALAPPSIEALNDLDELASTVATWVMLAVEEHPAGLRGPNWEGARVAPATRSHDADGNTVYYPARVVGVRAGEDGRVIGIAVHWIQARADWYAAQPWADDWHDELTKAARQVQARWPKVVRARKAPLPCPSCNKLTLWWHPAAFEGLDATIICHEDECGRVLTESDYWVQVMAKRNTLPRKIA